MNYQWILRKQSRNLVIFFGAGIIMQMFTRLNVEITELQKGDESLFDNYYNINMAPGKPQQENIVINDLVNIYNESGERIGCLPNNPLVYSESREHTGMGFMVYVKVYGWVWNCKH